MSTPTYIYKKLSEIGRKNTSENGEHLYTYADATHIDSFMQQALMKDGESLAYYISPVALGVDTNETARHVAKHICIRKTSENEVVNDHYTNVLDKPFVFLLKNGDRIRDKDEKFLWTSCILLPRNYKTVSSKYVARDIYQVFFFGNHVSNNFSDHLKNYLISGCEFFENETSKNGIKIQPFCKAEEIDIRHVQIHQLQDSDSGWWACYYSLMTVYTGNVSFFEHMKGKQISAMLLREIMPLASTDLIQQKYDIICSSSVMQLDHSEDLEYYKCDDCHTLGNVYELALSMLFLKRATDLELNFKIATENKDDGKFDDLSIEFSGKKVGKYFLQAKYKDDVSKKIIYRDLVMSKSIYSLSKYFESYCKIKKSYQDKLMMEYWNDVGFIICTTVDLDVKNLKSKSITVTTVDDLNWFLNKDNEALIKCYKLSVEDEQTCTEIFPELKIGNFSIEKISQFLNKLIFIVTQTGSVMRIGINKELANEYGPGIGKKIHDNLISELSAWITYRNQKGERYYLTHLINPYREAVKHFALNSWFEVNKPVSSFVGREEDLENLHESLQSKENDAVMIVQQQVLVSGLGGIGKSELARKYAHDYGRFYENNVIWIDAEKTSISESFERLAEALNIETRNHHAQKRSIEYIIHEVYKWFAQKKCLFIFDNAEEYREIERYLPNIGPDARKPYILVTTRNRELFNEQEHGKISKLELGVLPEEKAMEFVKNTLKIENEDQDEEIKELVGVLGCLPLALQHAAAYIRESNYKMKIKNYLSIYKDSTEEVDNLLDREGLDSYDRTIYVTFEITMEKIKRNKFALEILYLMSYFAPDNIPKNVFLQLAQSRIDEISNSLCENRSEMLLNRAVQLLEKYSMIDVNAEKVMLSIHRLLQQVIRLSLIKKDKNEVIETLSKAIKLVNNCDKWEKNQSHVTSIWCHSSSHRKLVDEFYFRNNTITTYHYNNATPLHLLAENGSCKEINSILNHIEKSHYSKFSNVVGAQDKYKRTALYMAAENNYLNIVKLLANIGGKVDTKSTISYSSLSTRLASGWTPVTIASFKGFYDIVKYLIEECGANPRVKDSLERIPAVLAAHSGHVAIVEFLTRALEPAERNKYLLHAKIQSAALCGQTKKLREFIKGIEKHDLNEILNSKLGEWTPLHLVAFKGYIEIAKILIESGATIAHNGFTQLHSAASNGHVDVVKLLIMNGANPNDVNEDGWTSLHGAAQNGCLDVVKYFIEDLEENNQIDINVRDFKDDTPLHTAAFHGKLKVVKYLLQKGARINCTNKWGGTPLLSASFTHRKKVIHYLLKRNDIIVDTIDINENSFLAMVHLSALHIAAAYNDIETVKILVEEKNIYVDLGKNEWFTPLHVAAIFGNSEVIKYLLEHNADINAVAENKKLTQILESLHVLFKEFSLFAFLLKVFVYFYMITPSIFFSLTSLLRTTPNACSKTLGYNDPLLENGSMEQGYLARRILSWGPIKDKIDVVKDFIGIKTCNDPREVRVNASRTWGPFHLFFMPD